MASPFKDLVCVITGASSGIGRAIAQQLAEQGAKLVIASHDPKRLEEVARSLRKITPHAIAVPTDVTSQSDCERLIDATVKEFGRLDVLFNNAGITMWTKFEDMKDLSPLERIMKVNYLGCAYCTYYAIPHLKKTRGRIVVTASISGKIGVPYRSGYCASKHAAVGFFDALRVELAEHGVTVTIACPNFVLTETHKQAFGADGKPLGESPMKAANAMTPDETARLMIDAAAKRKREIIMTAKAKAGVWLKLLLPGLVDKKALKAIEEGK